MCRNLLTAALPLNLLLYSEQGSGPGEASATLLEVLSLLAEHCSLGRVYEGSPDSETRRNCVAAIADICERLEGASCCGVELRALLQASVLPALHVAGVDYNIDKRGDTGSWSR